MRFNLRASRVCGLLVATIAVLLAANCVGLLFRFGLGHPRVFGLVDFFSFDAEYNLPTFYSGATLLLAAVLLAVCGKASAGSGRTLPRYWYALAGGFLFVALDEMLVFHERLDPILRDRLHTSGYLTFAWVIPYGLTLAAAALLLMRLLAWLPRRTRNLFVLSGALYLAGALGVEVVSAGHFARAGGKDLVFFVLATVEETLEMGGVALFVYALLDYLARRGVVLSFTVERSARRRRA